MSSLRPRARTAPLTAIEICAGAGGQALGLEKAGFEHLAVVEIDEHACATLRMNRRHWNVLKEDLRKFPGDPYKGAHLLAGGVPCPPFSVAGKQLGAADERDLFPEALRLVEEIEPDAVMLENVRGLESARFANYRSSILRKLKRMGYIPSWQVLNASDYGVPQLRPRFILVALRPAAAMHFKWPTVRPHTRTVGDTIGKLLAANGWRGASSWVAGAQSLAPTIVGGSKKHGGPDLGPTRAKLEWVKLGVDGYGIADEAPGPRFPKKQMPKLTVEMVARLQGFPPSWKFSGGKTAAYRQVGNAFPPPVAYAVGKAIYRALTKAMEESTVHRQAPGHLLLEGSSSLLAGT